MEAATRVRRAIAGFSIRDFGVLARSKYASLIAGVAARDEAALKLLLSPAALASVRAGWLHPRGCVGVALTSWEESVTGVVASSAKAGVVASGAMFGQDTPDDFVQLSFRAVTIQRETGEGGGGNSATRNKQPPRHRTDTQAPPGAWIAVSDEATGCVYYWDRLTGMTRWTAPRVSEFTAAGTHLPFVLAAAGGAKRETHPDGYVRVEHTITFERCTKDGQRSSDWYIVGL